jgi:hypothetical protein
MQIPQQPVQLVAACLQGIQTATMSLIANNFLAPSPPMLASNKHDITTSATH